MLKSSSLLMLTCVALVACSKTAVPDPKNNPWVRSQMGEELADTLANLVIMDDPIVKEPGMEKFIQAEINKAKHLAAEAFLRQQEGIQGAIIPIKADVVGRALYVDNMVYLTSDFYTRPGPSLHVYLTAVVDPRDSTFPDPSAVDLGPLELPYGPQQYSVPKQKQPNDLRTFVLYDTKLKRIYSFAQLSK